MQTRHLILKFFNIRQHESWLVWQLLGFQFFSGVALALFFTVASTTFLKTYSAHELPNVYVAAAFLLWLAGYIYSKAEHFFSLKTVLYGITAITALSCLVFWQMSSLHHSNPKADYLFFAWYSVMYLLMNLGFWALAALSFDVRQSKRLFSFISAGDIPSKMIGYASASLLVPYIKDINNLLIFAFIMMVFALYFLQKLSDEGKLHFHHEHNEEHEHHDVSIKETILGFFDNQLITLIAGVSLVVVVSSTLITYVFYAEVKHEIYANTNTQLAAFIGMFMASGRGLALLVKLVLTSRINSKLGILGSLLISPIIMLLLVLLTLILPYFQEQHLIFYYFGIMALVIEVLRSTIQDPALLSLFQPLKSDIRLRGHTIVKGIMDPFALLLSAFLLYFFNAILPEHNGMLIFGAVLISIIIWLILVWWINKAYFSALETALHNRYDVGRDLQIDNAHTVKMLKERMMQGEAGEAIYILELFQKNKSDTSTEILLSALKHSEQAVIIAALKGIIEQKILKALPEVKKMAHHATDNDIKAYSIEAVCMLQPDEIIEMTPYLDHQNDVVMRRSITGHLRSGGIEAVVVAGQKLLALIDRPEPSKRKIAAKVIGNIGLRNFYKPIETLLQDKSSEVARAAIIAAGKIKNEKLIHLLIEKLKGEHYILAQEALIKIGKNAVEQLGDALQNNVEEKVQKRIIFTLSKIHEPESHTILMKKILIIKPLQSYIFHCLSASHFPIQENAPVLSQCIEMYLQTAAFIKNALPHVSQTEMLAKAFQEELNILKYSLLDVFSLMYDYHKIAKAKYGLARGKQEGIANAFEILELLLPKETAHRFSAIFEENTQLQRADILPFEIEKFLTSIFNEANYSFLSWTKAVLMTEYPQYFLSKYENGKGINDDILLKDTFEYIKNKVEAMDNGNWKAGNSDTSIVHISEEINHSPQKEGKWKKGNDRLT